jgi:beta-N-acetylhexosaminidase
VRLLPLVQAVLALLHAQAAPAANLPPLTPREKAALVVVSGPPVPPGVGGVIVRPGDATGPFPRGALVFADQEGGLVKAYPDLPPWSAASEYTSTAAAFAAGRETGRALRRIGVDVDLAPVLDAASGPLGSRHFRRPELALAFARGLRAGGTAACVKHFPGLGSAQVSTDERPHVHARVRADELAAFRAAIDAGAECVMTSHALYGRFGGRRASLAPDTYRLLRRLGFRGVAITDSLDIAGSEYAVPWALRAVRAGADLVLFTNGRDARRAIRALIPLARRGRLDAHVDRVLRLRRDLGLRRP